MLIDELLKKDTYIVPEEYLIIILDINSDVFMSKNVKNKKYARHITRRVNLVRNGENWKMHNIEWCEGGLQLADINTKNVGEHDLTPRMKYIIE